MDGVLLQQRRRTMMRRYRGRFLVNAVVYLMGVGTGYVIAHALYH